MSHIGTRNLATIAIIVTQIGHFGNSRLFRSNSTSTYNLIRRARVRYSVRHVRKSLIRGIGRADNNIAIVVFCN